MSTITFGERIKFYRNNLKLSQVELSNILGVGKSTLAMYETDRREPNVIMIKKLSSALGISGDQLLETEHYTRQNPTTSANSEEDPVLYEIIEYYNEMNPAGQEELLKYSRLLSNAVEYKKCAEFRMA